MIYALKNEKLGLFLKKLQKKYTLIAPVKKNNFHVFAKVSDVSKVDMDYGNTKYSAKKFFLPNHETLFEYNGFDMVGEIPKEKRVLFGIRSCDVHALFALDKLYLDEYKDPYYESRRKNTLLLPVVSKKHGDNCFCESLGTDMLKDGYDLIFYEKDDAYIVKVGTARGKALIDNNFKKTNEKIPTYRKSDQEFNVENAGNLSNLWDAKAWDEATNDCFSCGACTVTCPTCGCFDVKDVPNLDLESGSRVRINASCQMKGFTEVAGGHVFREGRDKRFKHRIYHKFDYFPSQHDGMNMCVGCGRCITNCPAKIDMVKVVGKLK